MQEVKTVVCLFEKKSKYLPPIYDWLSHKDFRTEFCNPLMYQIEKNTYQTKYKRLSKCSKQN